MNNVSVVSDKKCFGYSICMSICSVNAIKMIPDRLGNILGNAVTSVPIANCKSQGT